MLSAMTNRAYGPATVRPRVVLITGGVSDGQDGIGDYTRLLCQGLRENDFPAVHVEHRDWGVRGMRKLLRDLDELAPDFVHVQHPQSTYGSTLTPQFLALIRPAVVTLHEASRYGPVRGRARLLPFLLRSRRVVVTSEFERDYVVGFAPWARDRVRVISLASNIPGQPQTGSPPTRSLVYFGSLRPDKGLEEFFEVATLVAANMPDVDCVVIGSPVRSSTDYAHNLRAEHSASPVRWLTGLNADAVSAELRRARVAYLPFPDGCSERRGSLLATAGCGLPTVTTAGRHTTPAMRASVQIAANTREAVHYIERLLTDDQHWTAMSERARRYGSRFRWDEIVRQHSALYADAWSSRFPTTRDPS